MLMGMHLRCGVNRWRRIVPLSAGEVGVHYKICKSGVLRGEIQTIIQEVRFVHYSNTGWLQRLAVGQESGKRESHPLGIHNQVVVLRPVEIMCGC